MDKSILIGNLCTFFAMVFNTLSSTRKTPQGVLWMQNISQAIYTVSAIFLKGYSAAVQSVVSILRNLTAIAGREEKWLQYLWVALGVVLGLYFNNRGLFGWLPVVANLEYSVAVFKFKDNERALKIAFCINIILFTIFNAGLFNIVGVCCSTVVLVTTIMSLVKGKKEKNSL